MKRFFKTMLSMLIVVVMLAQIFPVQLFVTPTAAAGGEPVYQYRAVNTLTPGKTYLIANFAGAANHDTVLLTVPDGTAEGGSVSTATVKTSSTDGLTIADFEGSEFAEWTIIPGRATSSDAGATLKASYMFQNVGTGAFLYNPVYDTGNGSGMNVTYNPLIDNYSPYSRQQYDNDVAISKYISYANTAGGVSSGKWIEVYGNPNSNNDAQAMVSFGNISAGSRYTKMSMIAHNNSVSTFAFYFFKNGGFQGGEGFSASTYLPANWSVLQTPGNFNVTSVSGTLNFARIDINEATSHRIYLSSTYLSNSDHANVALMYYLRSQAWYGGSGYYPSQRFPFAQFVPFNNNNGSLEFGMGNFALARVTNVYDQQYYYYWTSQNFQRSWNTNVANNIYFYEKQLVEDASYTWVRVTSVDQITNDGEYLIASQNSTNAANTSLFADNNGTVAYLNKAYGVSNDTLTVANTTTPVGSDINSTAVWKIKKLSASASTATSDSDFYFYLIGQSGKILYNYQATTNGVNTVSDTYTYADADLRLMSQGATGDTVSYGQRYIWKYDFSARDSAKRTGECLVSYSVAQNAGETATQTKIGYRTSSAKACVNNTCYLYKKTYCPHNDKVVKTDTQPDCTTDGLYWVYCNDCQSNVEYTVRPATGHNESKVVTQPQCEAQGYTTYTCTVCGASRVADYVAALGHDIVVTEVAAECEVAGYKIEDCSRCDYYVRTDYPALEHDWQVVSTEGNCQENGKTNYKCSLCGETKTETGAFIDHNYSSVVVTPPTCTDQGYTTYTCTNANCPNPSYRDNYTDALGHDFGEWYTVTHATTTSEGLDRRDCSRCDDYETKITPMLESAKLKGSEVETTPGQTVTIDFELRGNPGIWGMNFVIYWPESLTFVKLESSDEAFELGNVEGNENAPVDPATNARMAEYFADANIPNPGNYMALAYYVDNGGFENNYNDGKIVSITFTLPPEGECLKEYPVGVFGVFASSGNDIIDADGDSVADFTYIDGKITVPTGIDCDHSNYTTVTDSPATCTAPGAKHNVCNVCGHEFGHEVIPALGHSWTDFEIIREPSGLSAGISRRTCTVCGVYEDMTIEDKPATGTGISDSVNSELYRYYFTSRVYPGREYMILNASGAGSAYAMGATYDPLLDDNGDAYAGQFAVSSNQVNIEEGDYIINDNPALVWSTSTGFGFTNNATGTWLNGGLNHAEHVNQNVFTTATPYWNAETTQFTHQYKTIENIGSVSSESFSSLLSDDGLYIGFADVVAKAEEAKPANYFLKAGDNLFFKGSANGSRFYTDESWDFEFDISFREAEAYTTIYRDLDTESYMTEKSYDFALKITPENVTLMGVTDYNDNGNASKQYTIQTVDTTAHDHGEHSFDYTHWHHYRILCENKILRIYLDGHEIMVIRNYDIQPEFGFYFNVGTTKSGAAADGAVGLDNLFVRAQHGKAGSWTGSSWSDIHYEGGNPWGNTLYVSENFDSDADSDGELRGEYHGEWDLYSSGMQRAEVEGDSGVIDEEFIVAEDVFIASRDYRNKVYFYEKRLVSEMSAIYQLAEGLEGGEAYVLVKANQAGASTMFNASTGKTEDVTVYEDGVSISPVMETYLPYIDLFEIGGTRNCYDNSGSSDNDFKNGYGSACEFYATETEGGFLLNYVPVNLQENRAEEGTFLTPDGKFTSTATAANVIEVVDGKVTVNGEEYYVYKKVCVDQIDTAYESDMAVVDFGFGFSLNETFFRDNDPWADRVDVTLTGIAASLNAKENEWFYPLGTKLSGVGTTASFAEGTATMNGGISFANSGAYDSIVSVKYEGKVDHLSAYMYSTLYIIPATSVYYEDNIGFITYTDSNNIADGNGAWTTVAGDSPVVDVLDAQYGNSTTHSSYLQHSGNSVHYVKVGPANVPADYADGWMPTATFTFTGTGFDVISAVGRTTCVIFAEITDASGNYVDGLVVDNYLGYTYDSTEDKWTPSTGDNALQLYQVPVINWENTSAVPATYTVKISVAYDSYFDHAGVGYSEFYLDGLRIYNPLNLEAPENAVAVDKYKADKELIISDENLRRLLINSSTLEGSSTAGVMFIDGNGLTNTTDALATYNEVGAANEITLPAGNGIAFTVNADRVPEKVALGVKVANGGAGSVTVASGSNSTSVNVSTATDMYYDVTSGIEWNGTTATVVITNTGSGAVSLTKIKLTTGSDEVATADFYVNARTENIAYRTLATTFGVNGEEFVVGDVKETQTVNSVDTLVLKKYLAGNTEFDNREFAAADIDGDGDVDGKDAMLLKKLLVK